jgi:gamma-glutamyl-gamma-aminobutyrate hydrolase PuuD
MPPRIAIPIPHSTDREYGERAIPQYERAVVLAGGEPVRIPFDQTPEEVGALMERCNGVLLPGSNADIDPARFQQHARRTPRNLILVGMRLTPCCSPMRMPGESPCSASVMACKV